MNTQEIKAQVDHMAGLFPELRSRLERAALLTMFRRVFAVEGQPGEPSWVFLVESSWPDRFYRVDLGRNAGGALGCTCPDAPKAPRGLCKHQLAVALAIVAGVPLAPAPLRPEFAPAVMLGPAGPVAA